MALQREPAHSARAALIGARSAAAGYYFFTFAGERENPGVSAMAPRAAGRLVARKGPAVWRSAERAAAAGPGSSWGVPIRAAWWASGVVRRTKERQLQSGDPYVFGLSALSQVNDYFFARERESYFLKIFFRA